MASTTTATASSTLPRHLAYIPPSAFTPRARPPRLLKGQPHPNQQPPPTTGSPPGAGKRVWAQGKWRNPASNAAKYVRRGEIQRLERIKMQAGRGRAIYAFSNVRTNQVVYSLTKALQNKNLMSQLVYHGKKTVPSGLRPDMWRPYFTIEFPRTEYGIHSSLLAYRRLRELSLQRQLSPPDDMITLSQEDIEYINSRRDPYRDIEEEDLSKTRFVGKLLSKKARAKRLMDQTGTSVADVAFVLGLQADGPGPAKTLKLLKEANEEQWTQMGRRAKARAKRNAAAREERQKEIDRLLNRRRPSIEDVAAENGEGVTESTEGSVEMPPEKLERRTGETRSAFALRKAAAINSQEVKILWSDVRDAAYAEKWPSIVLHAERRRTSPKGDRYEDFLRQDREQHQEWETQVEDAKQTVMEAQERVQQVQVKVAEAQGMGEAARAGKLEHRALVEYVMAAPKVGTGDLPPPDSDWQTEEELIEVATKRAAHDLARAQSEYAEAEWELVRAEAALTELGRPTRLGPELVDGGLPESEAAAPEPDALDDAGPVVLGKKEGVVSGLLDRVRGFFGGGGKGSL